MNKNEMIKKAVIAHFACDKGSLRCDTKLEDSVDAAKEFVLHLTGHDSDIFNNLIEKSRYRVKLELIKRYIQNLKLQTK